MDTFVVRDLEVPLNTGLAEQLKPEHFAEDGVELHQCSQGAYYQEENSMSLWLKFSSNEAVRLDRDLTSLNIRNYASYKNIVSVHFLVYSKAFAFRSTTS